MKQQIRPIYGELQGYLKEAPFAGEHGGSTIKNSSLWEMFNSTIIELNNFTDLSFEKFEIKKIQSYSNGQRYIDAIEYRSRLGGLIARLHHTFFQDEPAPFSGMPSTNITVTNSQEQNQEQSIFLELITQIDEKISTLPEGVEKTFLQELREGIGSIKDFSKLMLLSAELCTKYGISYSSLASLLS